MTTFGDLVQQIKSLLRSYTGVVEQATYLTVACDANDLTLTVHDSDAVSIGISEIDDELIFVSVSQDGTLVVPPFGRGFGGSTAAAHTLNSMVTFDPAFPVVEIKRAVNQVLQAVHPKLYQVKTTTFTFTGVTASWELPADCEGVLHVSYEVTGASLAWQPIIGWRFDPVADHASGRGITFFEPPEQNRTVRIVYRAKFSEFASTADTFADVGFPESAIDVLLYGATAKLVRFMDLSRLQTATVENLSRAQVVGANDAGKVANQLYAMHITRLEEERKALLEAYPPQMNFTR